MFKSINIKEKTSNSTNCLIQLGLLPFRLVLSLGIIIAPGIQTVDFNVTSDIVIIKNDIRDVMMADKHECHKSELLVQAPALITTFSPTFQHSAVLGGLLGLAIF